MKNIIRKILKEDREQMFLDKIVHVMKNDFPLFKNMKDYGFYEQLSEEELNYVFSEIFGQPITSYSHGSVFDKNDNILYDEDFDGTWIKREYDENGRVIYIGNSDGKWRKSEYDENGNLIYEESYIGWWYKYEYDENGNILYKETPHGRKWYRR